MIYLSARALSLCVFPQLFGHVSKTTSAKQRLRMRYSVNYLHAEFFCGFVFCLSVNSFGSEAAHMRMFARACTRKRGFSAAVCLHKHARAVNGQSDEKLNSSSSNSFWNVSAAVLAPVTDHTTSSAIVNMRRVNCVSVSTHTLGSGAWVNFTGVRKIKST